MKKIIGFILGLLLFVGIVHATIVYPDHISYVNDFAHVLTQGFIVKENAKLKDYDNKTTNQIAVVTVDTTSPETIEEYSIHLAEKWKPGQKGKDNGVIFIIAVKDRQMRIEVGRGLEGDLTDLQSKEILNNDVKPELHNGNWEAGIDKGINDIIGQLSPSLAGPTATASATTRNIDGSAMIFFIIIVGVIILIVAISPYTPLGGEGTWGITSGWSSSDDNSSSDSGGSDFGGGSFSGGGASSGF